MLFKSAGNRKCRTSRGRLPAKKAGRMEERSIGTQMCVAMQKTMPLSRPRVTGRGTPCGGQGAKTAPCGARRSGVPERPEKGAQRRRKRFRKTARTKRAHTVGDECGFAENSRRESKRRKSHRIKKSHHYAVAAKKCSRYVVRYTLSTRQVSTAQPGELGAGRALPRVSEGRGATRFCFVRDLAADCWRSRGVAAVRFFTFFAGENWQKRRFGGKV